MTRDPTTDSRTRALGEWLDKVDKAVVSTTLTETPWSNSRIFNDARTAVNTLRAEEGTNVLVMNSATLIQSLLHEDLVDDLRLAVVPVMLGGGLRLLPDDAAGAWGLASTTILPHGAVSLHYRREQ
ncbi:dihydrofolate reductase family protein [Pseudonocardia nantongensis]|uniref:dihydrofolate reductase family protein n=1 Tax=Pseudonocardia nantongensis TaxID=1181885 RepID=UPI00397CE590